MQMNMQGNDLARILCLGFLLPMLLLLLVLLYGMDKKPQQPNDHQQTIPTTNAPTSGKEWEVSVLYAGQCRKLSLEEYVLGVVLAEMPASFQMEALKAQAVAARTYTLKHCPQSKPHGSNMICADAACCQAYIDPQAYIEHGGTQESVAKVRYAVSETAGLVLEYEGELIDATYFSCSGGTTEDALEVWGQDVPYLQSVPSPGEEEAAVFEDCKIFSPEEFQKALGVILAGKPENWFEAASYTDSGSIRTYRIGGVDYRGTTLRQLLGLRSTVFTVSVSKNQIIFDTRGFGHRVGMSQYGANAMAKAGSSFRDILTHYYTGTLIVQYIADSGETK